MPYMERHFHTLTSIRLKGLSQFTGWIKPGSYYHGVVAKKGQLHLCLHLAGTAPPKGHKYTAARVVLSPRKRRRPPQPVPLCWAQRVALHRGHTLTHWCPWRQVEWGMAGPGWNRPRPVPRKNGGETDLQSITSHCLGNRKVGLPIPSRSKTTREGMRW